MDAEAPETRPAGWYPDPVERHPYRFWDGSAWTAYAGAEQVVWDPMPEESHPTTPAPRAIGVAISAFAVGAVASWWIVEALRDQESVAVTMAASAAALWSVLLAAWLVVRLRAGDTRVGFRFRWSDIAFGLAGSLVARVMAGVALSPIPFPDQRLRDSQDVGERIDGSWAWIVLIVITCIGAPLIEEIFFRGVVQRRLVSRFGVVTGIAVSSALFGAAHLIGWDGPLSLANAWAIAASGIVLGVLYHLTGRLGTSIAAHAWFNAQAMLVIALFRS